MSTHASALGIGHKLQEYIIGRLLGHGGFGLTYLAQDTNLNSLVAIKEFLPQEFAVRTADHSVVPKSEFDADSYKWGLDRFKEEARALARFKHPNIVRVSRLLEANGTAYMVMDFEPGMTLSQYLKRHGPTLDEGRLLGMFLPVLDGLEALHRLQLVHRDIKPSNIYVRAYGGPMLIDFGAVRQAIGAQSRSLTSLVTPGYAPIEQYSSDGRQGAWSDLYAVGATIYYCMFGHAPADAAKRSAAISDGSEDPYAVAAMRGAENYSRELLECVDWALQFRVRDRPQSAQELRERLRSSPVPPQIIEVPESLQEVPELQHGVASAPTLPSPTHRTETVVMARDRGGAATGTTPPTGDATVVSNPTSRGLDSWAPFIEGKKPAAPPRRPLKLAVLDQLGHLRSRLQGLLAKLPKPDFDDPSTLTGRVALYVREPRGLRITLSAFVILVLASSLIIYVRRLGDDEHLYKGALAANSVSAYQDYLDHCGRCAHKAEAQAALAALQKAAQLAALDAQFKELLAKKALMAPADPNAGGLLQQMQALAPDDPLVKSGRAALDAAMTQQKDALAAEQKRLAAARVATQHAATAHAKPTAKTVATTQSGGSRGAAPPVQAAPNEVLPQPKFTPAPRYPIGVKGISGWVDVEFTVNLDGSVSELRIIGSQPQGVFDDAAMHAVHNWIFVPATLNGSRERKRIHMRVDFKP